MIEQPFQRPRSPECMRGAFSEAGLPLYGVPRRSVPEMPTWQMRTSSSDDDTRGVRSLKGEDIAGGG
jgi:hypothetical protein